MHSNISEFSYGYALTETIISAFPSLIEEGKKGGGYDVKIPFPEVPVFLQFKLSHCMVKITAYEAYARDFKTPFYRIHLRPTRCSQQHPMLLELEVSGASVFYADLKFHAPSELNTVYIKKTVARESLFFRPSSIGYLDDKDHNVSFLKFGGNVCLYSKKPRVLSAEDFGVQELVKSVGGPVSSS